MTIQEEKIKEQIRAAEKAKEQAVSVQHFYEACYYRDEIARLERLLEKIRLENDRT